MLDTIRLDKFQQKVQDAPLEKGNCLTVRAGAGSGTERQRGLQSLHCLQCRAHGRTRGGGSHWGPRLVLKGEMYRTSFTMLFALFIAYHFLLSPILTLNRPTSHNCVPLSVIYAECK